MLFYCSYYFMNFIYQYKLTCTLDNITNNDNGRCKDSFNNGK